MMIHKISPSVEFVIELFRNSNQNPIKIPIVVKLTNKNNIKLFGLM